MKASIPKIVLAFTLHVLNPFLHAVVLLRQYFLITISEIHIPGNDSANICPTGRTASAGTKHIGNNEWNTSILFLVSCDVLQPFCKKIIYIHIERCRS